MDENADPVIEARQRLLAVLNNMHINPQQAGVCGYLQATLDTARVAAILEYLTTETNGTWTPKERLDSLMVKHLTDAAEALQATQAQPRIVTPTLRVNGH